MRILVTGVTGFLGGRFAAALAGKGIAVAEVGRRASGLAGLTFYPLSCDFSAMMAEFRPTHIVHFAAGFDNGAPDDCLFANVTFPMRLLEASKNRALTFIYISSYWELGDAAKPGVPIDFYSASKASVAPFLDYYAAYHAPSCHQVYLYGSYGHNDKRSKILDLLLDAALDGTEIDLSPSGQKLNLLHVDDIVRTLADFLAAGPREKRGRFSIYSDIEVTPADLVAMIRQYKPLKANIGARPYRDVELMQPRYDVENLLDHESVSLEDYIRKRLLR